MRGVDTVKKPIFLITLLLAANPALAEDQYLIDPARMDAVREDIFKSYPKEKGWCDAPQAPPKPGQIAITWHYDENGACVIQKAEAGTTCSEADIKKEISRLQALHKPAQITLLSAKASDKGCELDVSVDY